MMDMSSRQLRLKLQAMKAIALALGFRSPNDKVYSLAGPIALGDHCRIAVYCLVSDALGALAVHMFVAAINNACASSAGMCKPLVLTDMLDQMLYVLFSCTCLLRVKGHAWCAECQTH
jgi:hypothetical protein